MNEFTKDDLQFLLGEYYKLHKIEIHLKQCVLLYYPTMKDYKDNRTAFEDQIATMLTREKQVVLQNSEIHKGKQNKSPEQHLETELRRMVKNEISELYRKIGKMVYGEEEYYKYIPKKSKGTPTISTPTISNSNNSNPAIISPVPFLNEDIDNDVSVKLTTTTTTTTTTPLKAVPNIEEEE